VLLHLEATLKDNYQTPSFVREDEDWVAYLDDTDFKAFLAKYEERYYCNCIF